MFLLGAAASVIAVAGIKAAAGIVAPVFMALLLVISVEPIHRWGVRHGLPRWLSVLGALLGAYVLIVGLSAALIVMLGRFAALLPMYVAELHGLLALLDDRLRSLGAGTDEALRILVSVAPTELPTLVERLLAGAFELSSKLLLILTLLLFVAMDAARLPSLLESYRAQAPSVVAALEGFVVDTRRYVLATTLFGAVMAAIDTLWLFALGVPSALLWGLLAFVANYVPVVGMVVGLVPPAMVALLEGGPWLMFAVIVGYCVVNFVIESVIEHKFVADAVDLPPTILMLSAVFWTWVLGPPGALLAIPLTLLVKALAFALDEEPSLTRPRLGETPNVLIS
jgi:predicted PurR-regulated permease PerM